MAYLLRLWVRVWVFALFGAVFLVLLIVGGLGMLVLLVWSLISGKRPVAFAKFADILRTSKGFRGGAWPSAAGNPPNANADVVDVQAHEVRSTLEDRR
jgi:hypothetical protein